VSPLDLGYTYGMTDIGDSLFHKGQPV